MRDALVVFLVVGLPEVFVLRIPPEHHLDSLHPIVDTFSRYTGKGIGYEIPVEIRTYYPHDGMVDYSPRHIVLPGYLPFLAGVIMHHHIRKAWIRKVESENHLLDHPEILLGPEIVPPDVPILLHLTSLSLLVGCSEIVHVGNLLEDMSYSLWHRIIVWSPY